MTYSPCPSKAKRAGGFTLVELLTVIAIMALLMVVAVPNMRGLTQGSGLNASVNELKATLSLARQWAITRGETTYVVFPDDLMTYGGNNRGAQALRSYNVYTRSDGYIRDWSVLKPGIYFIPSEVDDPTGHSNDSSNIFDSADDVESIPFPSGGSAAQDIPFVAFKPSGGLLNGASSRQLYLTEAILPPSGGNTDPGRAEMIIQADAPVVGVRVLGTTGIADIQDYQDAL